MTQATAPAAAQVQEPVHAIQQQQETVNRLENWLKNTPDNDPHAGTDMEEPPRQEEQQPEAAPEAGSDPAPETVELDEETPLFEIEYKTDTGKEQKKLSLKELREGYLAKSDYMRNIQKVKAQEAELSRRVQEAETKAAQDYLQKLEMQKQAVIRLAGVKPMAEIEAMAATDPAEAQREFLRFISVNQTLQGIEQEQSQAAQRLTAEKQSQRQQAIRQAWETLSSDIPNWSQETYMGVLKTAKDEFGVDATDVIDAGLIKALHDAAEYRKLQKAKPEITKRVVAVPKVIKPGSADKPNPAQEQVNRSRERLRKSGDWRDAAAALLARQK